MFNGINAHENQRTLIGFGSVAILISCYINTSLLNYGQNMAGTRGSKYKIFLEFDLLGSSTTLRVSERLFSNSLTLDETIACVAVR